MFKSTGLKREDGCLQISKVCEEDRALLQAEFSDRLLPSDIAHVICLAREKRATPRGQLKWAIKHLARNYRQIGHKILL
jgi:hypothetical protein